MAKDFSLVELKMQEIEQELQKLTTSIGEINNYLKDIKTDFTDLEGNAVYRPRGEWEQRLADYHLLLSLTSSRKGSKREIRRQMVFTLRDGGHSQEAIAGMVNISQSSISRMLEKRRKTNECIGDNEGSIALSGRLNPSGG